ncbi:hypothetical protein BRAS3809_2440002 [Bradyrhizobium sp. STM 3809]|nr:hypothetical protein BRAS3809_2440002 [Bradyrhizobium sp. STM 3809]
MGQGRDLRGFLDGEAEAYADDVMRFAQVREGVVVVAAAIADAVAAAVEGRERHQHDVRHQFGRHRRRLGNPERTEHQPVTGRIGAERQRMAARQHHRQRQTRALPGQFAHQRHRIELVADRRIARDHQARLQRERQAAGRDGLRGGGSVVLAEGVARRERRGAELLLGVLSGLHRHATGPPFQSARARARQRCRNAAGRQPMGNRQGQEDGQDDKSEAAIAVETLDPGVPYESRWAPYVRVHGPGQGQFPKGSIRPRGYVGSGRASQPRRANVTMAG